MPKIPCQFIPNICLIQLPKLKKKANKFYMRFVDPTEDGHVTAGFTALCVILVGVGVLFSRIELQYKLKFYVSWEEKNY